MHVRNTWYNQAMPTKKRKRYYNIRMDEATYNAVRKIAHRLNMKLIDVLRAQYVHGLPIRKGI